VGDPALPPETRSLQDTGCLRRDWAPRAIVKRCLDIARYPTRVVGRKSAPVGWEGESGMGIAARRLPERGTRAAGSGGPGRGPAEHAGLLVACGHRRSLGGISSKILAAERTGRQLNFLSQASGAGKATCDGSLKRQIHDRLLVTCCHPWRHRLGYNSSKQFGSVPNLLAASISATSSDGGWEPMRAFFPIIPRA